LPRVTLRWRNDEKKSTTEHFNSGYALKVAFGTVTNGRMPGRIYLCLPDEAKSFVAGAFDAEIRKAEPRRRPPRKTSPSRTASSSRLWGGDGSSPVSRSPGTGDEPSPPRARMVADPSLIQPRSPSL
jgi:hypothetical protein